MKYSLQFCAGKKIINQKIMFSSKLFPALILGTTMFLGLITLSFLNDQMFINELLIIGFILGCLVFMRLGTTKN